MKRTSFDLWLPAVFSAALSFIALVTYVASGNSGAWIPAFLCFLPGAFWFAALSENRTRERLEALETRIERMEAGKAALPGDDHAR